MRVGELGESKSSAERDILSGRVRTCCLLTVRLSGPSGMLQYGLAGRIMFNKLI